MTEKKPPVRKVAISLAMYEQMLALWREKQSVSHVAKKMNLSYMVARRVITSGVKELNLGPFPGHEVLAMFKVPGGRPEPKEPCTSPISHVRDALGVAAMEEVEAIENEIRTRISSYDGEALKLKQELEDLEKRGASKRALDELRYAFGRTLVLERTLGQVKREAIAADQLQRSAQEEAVARLSLKVAAQVLAIVAHINEKITDGIDNGTIEIPAQINARTLVQLTRAADSANATAQKAHQIERLRRGEPEQTPAIVLATMVNNFSDTELTRFLDSNQLPSRVAALPGPPRPHLEVVEAESQDLTDECPDDSEQSTGTD